ncbi:MAG: C40 family peptidase [Leptospiraceae bacterium]|nr:C40 family peptidase [Leptospiraceae bacterium]MCP5510616.1 C40 family peptidase [Leptospiraceae bacterium]
MALNNSTKNNYLRTFKVLLILILTIFSISIQSKSLTKEQKLKLRKTSDWLSKFSIRYAGEFTPPGQNYTLRMDCSNTARFIYEEALGVHLPRTSFDQYNAVKNSGNLKTPPRSNGKIDTEQLGKILKPGDLLFWINTHSDIPKKWDPPIGHVMVYLGKNKKSQLVMTGAGTYGKGKRTQKGGIDIYLFDPNAKIGCVRDSNRKCIKNSEFFGFGKPSLD